MTSVASSPFGTMPDGTPVTQYTMTNAKGSSVSVISYGAALTGITLATADGPVDVLLGYDNPAAYEVNGGHLGGCIGRVGNRIGHAQFTLNGITYPLAANNGINHLHGGKVGFDKCHFELSPIPGGVRAHRVSPDGEEGYPGNLDVIVDYLFDDDDRLSLVYHAVADADTPVNLTNHAYFNLSGEGDGSILDHEVTILASRITEAGEGSLPTGRFLDVAGTAMDFTSPKAVGKDIQADDPQLAIGNGYDHNYVPDGEGFRLIAKVRSPKTGIEMTVFSDLPGVQFYTGNSLRSQIGKSGAAYVPRSGLCLETQYHPNAFECPDFPSIVLPKGAYWDSRTEYRFFY